MECCWHLCWLLDGVGPLDLWWPIAVCVSQLCYETVSGGVVPVRVWMAAALTRAGPQVLRIRHLLCVLL